MKRISAFVSWPAAAMLLLATTSVGAATGGKIAPNPNRNVTFLSTSDCHFRTADRRTNNDWDHETIDQMNGITDLRWPEQLGGGGIDKPRGAVVLGDCIDDGDVKRDGKNWSAEQFGYFVQEFGLSGIDGHVKYPVFEGWGNHDGPPVGQEKNGFSFQAELKKRNTIRQQKGLISNLSANGLHYSWDWDDVHFIQLNLYPADRQNPKVHYSSAWHDPQGSLSFLKEDLAKCVGESGRPVVLMSHCGFDTNWWVDEDWKAAYDAAKDYHVILYLYGHSGTGLREWAPPGETRTWTCINDGQTTAGFFLLQIQGNRLRAAYRTRDNVTYTKAADGKSQDRAWDGTWTWKWLLDKPLDDTWGMTDRKSLTAPRQTPLPRPPGTSERTGRESRNVDVTPLFAMRSDFVPALRRSALYLIAHSGQNTASRVAQF
jgi:cytolysin (calcineurin-like family phosphatase)